MQILYIEKLKKNKDVVKESKIELDKILNFIMNKDKCNKESLIITVK